MKVNLIHYGSLMAIEDSVLANPLEHHVENK